MIRYWYDTEFIEDGCAIELISIGIVAEDGRDYYAVNQDMPIKRIRKHPWLMANVVPHLPKLHGDARNHMPKSWLFNYSGPGVKPHRLIADEVRDFLLEPREPMELWTYYGAYDHVVMSWLWGPMVNRPAGIPMFSFDLMQFAASLGLDDSTFPRQTGALHNALEDARWTKQAWEYLNRHPNKSLDNRGWMFGDHNVQHNTFGA